MTEKDGQLLDGEALADRLRRELARRVASRFGARPPGLAILSVAADDPTRGYITRKLADCEEVGIAGTWSDLPATISEAALLDRINTLNEDAATDGLIVQLPLPEPIDPARIARAIDPAKDADALTPSVFGRFASGAAGPMDPVPCTARAIQTLLLEHGVPIPGRNVVILGRGLLTGRPLSILLSQPGAGGDATVTLCHRRGGDWRPYARRADILISAVGEPDLVTAADIKPGAAVVGVGLTWGVDGPVSDLAGDVAARAGWVTPREGRVGAMTRLMLLENTVRLAESRPVSRSEGPE